MVARFTRDKYGWRCTKAKPESLNLKGVDMFGKLGVMAVIALVLNLAFWGGLIFIALWCLRHFGII